MTHKGRRLATAHLQGMLVNDFVMCLLHPETIEDKEQCIANFAELVNNSVMSVDDVRYTK